jgi:hypothetical protein
MFCGNEVFKDVEYDKAVAIGMVGNPTRENADRNRIVNWDEGSEIVNLELQVVFARCAGNAPAVQVRTT